MPNPSRKPGIDRNKVGGKGNTSARSDNKPPRSQGASRGHLSGAPIKSGLAGGRSAVSNKDKGSARPQVRVKPLTSNRESGFSDGKRPYDYAFYEKAEATPEYLASLFAERAYSVTARELEAYWKYYCLLREHNAVLDLTRIMGIEATVLKHFIDCSIIADLTPLEGPVLDIGSGPGFPGAPIAIRRPDLPVILAESRGKRVKFLEMVKTELNLKNVTIFPRSVREDSNLNARTIVTRAVEVIPATLQRVCPFLSVGGRVVFMKGPGCGQEITEAQESFKGVYRLTEDLHYDLPQTDQNRRLVVFTRCEME